MKTLTKHLSFPLCLFLMALIFRSVDSHAGNIGLNFIGNPDIWHGAMLPDDSAGIPEFTQTNWNNAANPSGSLTNLLDDSGHVTSMSVTWRTALGTHGLNVQDGGDYRMMRGYLDAGGPGQEATVTITGIPYDWYDVIVYFDGDTDGRMRVGGYTVNGVTVYGTDTGDFDGKYVEVSETDREKAVAGNYVRFTGQVAKSLTVTAFGVSAPDEFLRAPINGIQIVEVPDPSAFGEDSDTQNLTSQVIFQR